MPIPMKEKQHKDVATVVLDIESKDCELTANSQTIGWNVKKDPEDSEGLSPPNFFAEVQESHKQITDRFVELLNLFEDYSKIMESEQTHFNPQPKLKRTQSEQFSAVHSKSKPNLSVPATAETSELLKSTVSLNHMQCSDCTLLEIPRKLTCEVSCQTGYCNILPPKDDSKQLLTAVEKPKKLDETEEQREQLLNANQHTLHIEVESVSSITALQRAPLRQRLWQVLLEAWQAILACLYMMGENFTYVLFILLCMWCLYLIFSHYYNFLDSQKHDIKKSLTPTRGQPT